MKKLRRSILEGILFGALAYLYFGNFGSAIVVGGAWLISEILFGKKKNGDIQLLFACAITFWIMAMQILFFEKGLIGFFVIPIIFTILFIIELIKEKHPKEKVIAKSSKYETDLNMYMKKFNRINMILSVIMLILVICSFFLIPYEILEVGEITLFLITQILLFLFIVISMYWGGIFNDSKESKNSAIKFAKLGAIGSIVTGNLYGVSMLQNVKENGEKTYVSRWSIQPFYVLLIVIVPLLIICNVGLPFCYDLEMDSLGEAFIYSLKNIPFVQVNTILIFLIYVVAYVPFTIAGFIKEKIINEEYKYISLKQFFRRNIITSLVLVTITVGMYSGMLFIEDSPQNKLKEQVNEQLEKLENKQVTITEEDLTIDFNNNDYTYMQNEITDTLENEAIYKLVTLKEVETDANGEKYITAIFAGYGKNDEKVTCFMFRKYLTSSEKHTKGDIELYMTWISDSITKESVLLK